MRVCVHVHADICILCVFVSCVSISMYLIDVYAQIYMHTHMSVHLGMSMSIYTYTNIYVGAGLVQTFIYIHRYTLVLFICFVTSMRIIFAEVFHSFYQDL